MKKLSFSGMMNGLERRMPVSFSPPGEVTGGMAQIARELPARLGESVDVPEAKGPGGGGFETKGDIRDGPCIRLAQTRVLQAGQGPLGSQLIAQGHAHDVQKLSVLG